MSSLYRRINSVIPLVAASTLAGKEGYFYKLDSSNEAVIVANATDVPHGLILSVREDGLEISAAPLGGNHGTALVKLGGAVTDLRKDLTVKADGTAESDDGAGARVVVARPLETGDAGEMIECVLLPAKQLADAETPEVVALTSTNGVAATQAPAALTSTNGVAGAADDDLPGLAAETEKIGDDVRALHAKYALLVAETEKIGDDVRAIHAALVSKGILSAS